MDFAELSGVFILGCSVGLVSSVLGLGGGFLIVPLLPLLTEVTQKEAVATSLLTILFVVANNTVAFHRRGLIDWSVARRFGLMSAVGSSLSALVAGLLSDWWLKLVMFCVFVAFSVKIFLALMKNNKSKTGTTWSAPGTFSQWLVAVFAGSLLGTTGLGLGLVMGPYFIRHNMMPAERISPTTNASMILTSLAGVLMFSYQGHLAPWPIFLCLIAGAFTSAWVGQRIQAKVTSQRRSQFLMGALILLSLRVLFDLIKTML